MRHRKGVLIGPKKFTFHGEMSATCGHRVKRDFLAVAENRVFAYHIRSIGRRIFDAAVFCVTAPGRR